MNREKHPCLLCGEDTHTYMVNLSEVLKKNQERTYVCHNCIETYLDDNEIDVVMEYSIGRPGSKWEGRKFFEKAIIIDCPASKLIPYYHRAAHSWKTLQHSSRVWYDTYRQEEVDNVIRKYFNRSVDSISPKQLKYVNVLLKDVDTPDTKATIYKEYGVDSLKKLSKAQAAELIDRLIKIKEVN